MDKAQTINGLTEMVTTSKEAADTIFKVANNALKGQSHEEAALS